jgi:hypothetical protein
MYNAIAMPRRGIKIKALLFVSPSVNITTVIKKL